MRTLALLILLSFACHAGDDRQRLLERLVDAGPGTAVRIKTLDGRNVQGRVLAVETEIVRLQSVVKEEIRVVEVPVAEIRSCNIRSKEVGLHGEVKKNATAGITVLGVFAAAIGILYAL